MPARAMRLAARPRATGGSEGVGRGSGPALAAGRGRARGGELMGWSRHFATEEPAGAVSQDCAGRASPGRCGPVASVESARGAGGGADGGEGVIAWSLGAASTVLVGVGLLDCAGRAWAGRCGWVARFASV